MKLLTDGKISEIKSALQKELAEAEKFAEESPLPDVSDLTQDVYT
jgi:pyruvate dehydrogenase E1 component alpha subunit